MNWEIILILPKIEYLLKLEKAEKWIKSKDIPINNNIRINLRSKREIKV